MANFLYSPVPSSYKGLLRLEDREVVRGQQRPPPVHEKGIQLNLSGNEVYYTNSY